MSKGNNNLKHQIMNTMEMFSGKVTKKFLLVETGNSSYNVSMVEATDDDIINSGIKSSNGEYEYLNDDEYQVLTPTSYNYGRKITHMDIGDAIELDCDVKLIRLA